MVSQDFVGLLNPRAPVFFIAAFAHFVNRTSGDVTAQLGVLGGIFTVLTIVSDSAWGHGAVPRGTGYRARRDCSRACAPWAGRSSLAVVR